MKNVRLGEKVPRFYLPVSMNHRTGKKECHFFLLAPFVMFMEITKHSFQAVWYDLMDLLVDLKAHSAQRKAKK